MLAADVVDGARELGLDLTTGQGEQLARFAALLGRWNAVHNLTAIDSPDSVLTHHLLDSLALLPSTTGILRQNQTRVLDIGSGGGLPGIPVAVARPAWQVTLVDKVQKKVAFLTQARLELGLVNVACIHARAEELKDTLFDLIVSRAFASLEEFVKVSARLIADGGWWAAMKGAVPKAEIAQLAKTFPEVRVVDIVKLDVPRLDAERHLILLQRP
ncbi:MAG: 16S rRNA (guanine(527)-N(7))-methyltransferase RsmG [Mycobacterium sp.]